MSLWDHHGNFFGLYGLLSEWSRPSPRSPSIVPLFRNPGYTTAHSKYIIHCRQHRPRSAGVVTRPTNFVTHPTNFCLSWSVSFFVNVLVWSLPSIVKCAMSWPLSLSMHASKVLSFATNAPQRNSEQLTFDIIQNVDDKMPSNRHSDN